MSGICHLICGLPGTGKTMLARRIETETGALRLSPDEWLQVLRGGGSVVWEKGFWARAERDGYRSQAETVGAQVRLYLLEAPLPELRRRLVARNAASPPEQRINPEDLDLWASWFEPYGEDERAFAVRPALPAARG